MAESCPSSQAGAYVSLRLVAKAAGISLGEMRRIAGEIAAGHRREWLGATVEVRTLVQGRTRRREIAAASLPPVLVAELAGNRLRFLVAAEQALPDGELRHADFMLLHRAAQCPTIPADIFARLITNLEADGGLLRATRSRFDLVMDYLFGFDFRDEALPYVAPDYLAWLEQARLCAGLDEPAYAALLAEVGQTDRPERLTGANFYMMLAHLHQRFGVRLRLPSRQAMSRFVIGQIHLAVYGLRLPYADHIGFVSVIGGGCVATRDLDERGQRRLLAYYYSRGFISPEPPPRIADRPGFITQPQANLIWKLWRDYQSNKAETSEAALSDWLLAHLGHDGGLHSLTAAGTRRALDLMLAPVIDWRLKTARYRRTRLTDKR